MPNDSESKQSINVSESTASPEPDQNSKTGGFIFPGTLKLHTKLLSKENDMLDHESLYRLRYQVYCNEAHFLDPENYPDGLEFDEFDTVAEHFLTKNTSNNDEIVGTVRLIKWSEHFSFPTAVYFQSLQDTLVRLKFPLDSTAEISRLCISKKYRRRSIDGLLVGDGSADSTSKRRKLPVVILDLFKSMYLASKYNLGITHWIATFEDSLYRLLNRYGVHFKLLIPQEIDYYGKVKIYGASLSHLEETMKKRRPELYDFFRGQPVHA